MPQVSEGKEFKEELQRIAHMINSKISQYKRLENECIFGHSRSMWFKKRDKDLTDERIPTYIQDIFIRNIIHGHFDGY